MSRIAKFILILVLLLAISLPIVSSVSAKIVCSSGEWNSQTCLSNDGNPK